MFFLKEMHLPNSGLIVDFLCLPKLLLVELGDRKLVPRVPECPDTFGCCIVNGLVRSL